MPVEAGIHLQHKPVGVTSFSLVRAMMAERDAAPGKRLPLCHGGTLDPFAQGLMLLLVGPATHLFEPLHTLPKTYVAEIEWGAETDNGDPGGAVVARGDASSLTPEMLDAALAPFMGWREQVPPTTSAKKVRGEPAYRRVHRGEPVELPPSQVYLHQARWRAHALPGRSTLWLVCRGGFYVRALARDLGRALGCRAHVSALSRTAIGPWQDPAAGERTLVTGRAALPWCQARCLSDQEWGDVRRGASVPRGALEPPLWAPPRGFPDLAAPIAATHQERVVALLESDGAALRPARAFQRGL